MSIVDPNDPLERQNQRLQRIVEVLIARAENDAERPAGAPVQPPLDPQNIELERTLDLLNESNLALRTSNDEGNEARRYLSDMVEALQDGVALFDSEARLVVSNPKFCSDFSDQITDLSPGTSLRGCLEQMGRSHRLRLPQGQDTAAWVNKAHRALRNADGVLRIDLTTGGTLETEAHLCANGSLLIVQTKGLPATAAPRDLSALASALNAVPFGLCVFDSAARLITWNDALPKSLGIKGGVLVPRMSLSDLFDAMDGTVTSDGGLGREQVINWAESPSLRPNIAFELRRRTTRVLALSGRQISDGGFTLTVTDVTADRETTEELIAVNALLEQRAIDRTVELEDALTLAERSNASKTRFVAAASHDLLQPISAAKLFLASLSDRMATPSDTDILAKTEAALGSAEQIIDGLLNISRLDSAEHRFDIRSLALRDIFDPLRNEMGVLANQKGINLTVVDTDLRVESDPAFLRRIVQNLVSNAVRFTDSGKVVVGVRRAQGNARIEVWDSGPGIADEDQASIFEEFRRLNDTKSGLGLGLAIVERACARLGHVLGLRSSPGKGSCFSVSVPILEHSSDEVRSPEHTQTGLVLPDSGLIVLLVENDPQMCRALSLLMEGWGIDVIEAHDSPSAMQLLADLQITPDALVLDYLLGTGTTGTQLFEFIKIKYGRLPCAIVSADRSPALRATCRRLDLDLVNKPVDQNQLIGFLTEVAKSV